MDGIPLKYTGEVHPPNGGEWNEKLNRQIYPYYPDRALKEAVNLAIRLNRPLLLEGEPGCGKSDLARAVFYEFSKKAEKEKDETKKITWNYRLWNIQSTSKAQDGFYSYDYIGRLQAAQLAKVADIKDKGSNPAKPEDYIEWGALGYAFGGTDEEKSQNNGSEEKKSQNSRSIVLIDEIDKASTDFPNDLLLALEDKRFKVKEVKGSKGVDKNGWLIADRDAFPIIFITSNQEKELPNAFLRRCLYHHIEFPDEKQLTKIIKGRFEKSPNEIVEAAIKRFLDLRSEMNNNEDEMAKKVSTSELIDWFTILLCESSPEEALNKLNQKKLPYISTLLKTRQGRIEYDEA
ncbi:MAG: MoxR family ATPase [Mastigocoleus sp. MO_167.B18]|nr:MoxR family ATPase [Mastigocoleus sp. MO_167.B18]